MIMLDMSTYCTECAPTDAEARRLWGAGPFDPASDLIKVAPVSGEFAELHELACEECERPLTVEPVES